MINSIGTLSGYLGPVLIGRLKEATQSYSAGLAVIAAGMACSAVLALVFARGRDVGSPASKASVGE
jgi:ACS family tartrate transporter-like MFS transporter